MLMLLNLAPFSYFEIITNIIIGYYFFGDFPDNWTFLGLLLLFLQVSTFLEEKALIKIRFNKVQ